MPQPPRSRGPRPPRPESTPARESSVYRHPDAQRAAGAAPAGRGSYPRDGASGARPAPRGERGPRSAGSPAPRTVGPQPRFGEGPPSARRDEPRARPERAPGPALQAGRPASSGPWKREDARAPRRPDPVREREPEPAPDPRREQRRREVRIHGRAACLAVAEDRFGGIRKLWCSLQRSKELAPLLSRLAQARVGYTVVADEELERLAESQHHEGLVMDAERLQQPALAQLFGELVKQSGPACMIALDGVGNPHNFGAILRSAVHFGARAVLVPAGTSLTLSGAAYRVAEGAAERIPVVRYEDLAQLKDHGFSLIATAGAGEQRLYRDPLPARCILLFGAEGPGLARPALEVADARIAIPGSGRVDSLNVGQAVAVVLGEWWRGARAQV